MTTGITTAAVAQVASVRSRIAAGRTYPSRSFHSIRIEPAPTHTACRVNLSLSLAHPQPLAVIAEARQLDISPHASLADIRALAHEVGKVISLEVAAAAVLPASSPDDGRTGNRRQRRAYHDARHSDRQRRRPRRPSGNPWPRRVRRQVRVR